MKEKIISAAMLVLMGGLVMVGLKAVEWIIPSPDRVITVKVER